MKKLLLKLLSFFPSKLPLGMSDFKAWADEVVELAELPINDTMHWTLANMLIESDKLSDAKPKRFYVKRLRKAAVNQVAAFVMHDLQSQKVAKDEDAKKAAAARPVESVVQESNVK